jgi:hypothetical protein
MSPSLRFDLTLNPSLFGYVLPPLCRFGLNKSESFRHHACGSEFIVTGVGELSLEVLYQSRRGDGSLVHVVGHEEHDRKFHQK